MRIVNNKIVECTEDELYKFWLDNWSEFFSFDDYLRRMKEKGVKVIDS